ncbi:MAG TPA: hypothetical protein VJ276_20575 [Thermoanaerobaculia bacterium]|nr:hypothetical protein [Thermoanaerobaculia bacterium]
MRKIDERRNAAGLGAPAPVLQLAQLYGDQARLTLAGGAEGGVVAEIVVPYG